MNLRAKRSRSPFIEEQVAGQIALIDEDENFSASLCQGLARLLPKHWQLRCFASSSSFRRSVGENPAFTLVIIQDKLCDLSFQRYIAPTPFLLRSGQITGVTDEQTIAPGLPLAEIYARIQKLIPVKTTPAYKLSSYSPEGLWMVYAFSETVRRHYLNQIMQRFIREGRLLYYVGFAPTYALSPNLTCSSGPDLSSLLLLLAAGHKLEAAKLGQFFELQQAGFYCLRCGSGSSEDFLQSSPSTRKYLLQLLRAFLASQSSSATMLIELAQLPLSHLSYLLSFADYFVYERPLTPGLVGQVARQELGRLLAGLPKTVQFCEASSPYLSQYEGKRSQC